MIQFDRVYTPLTNSPNRQKIVIKMRHSLEFAHQNSSGFQFLHSCVIGGMHVLFSLQGKITHWGSNSVRKWEEWFYYRICINLGRKD